MKCLSIRQPWAWLIVNGFKDIENRSWKSKIRGEIFVHAAKGMTLEEYNNAYKAAKNMRPSILIPEFDQLDRGGIVGTVNIIDCVRDHPSPWKIMGTYGFVLESGKPLPFFRIPGRLSFFDAPLGVEIP